MLRERMPSRHRGVGQADDRCLPTGPRQALRKYPNRFRFAPSPMAGLRKLRSSEPGFTASSHGYHCTLLNRIALVYNRIGAI